MCRTGPVTRKKGDHESVLAWASWKLTLRQGFLQKWLRLNHSLENGGWAIRGEDRNQAWCVTSVSYLRSALPRVRKGKGVGAARLLVTSVTDGSKLSPRRTCRYFQICEQTAKHRARGGDPRVTYSRKGSALQAVGNSHHFLESFYFPGKMIASARGGWHADGKHRTGAYSGGGIRGRRGRRIVLADVYMGMTCAGLCSGFSQNHRYRNTSILEFISKNSSYTHAPTHPASSINYPLSICDIREMKTIWSLNKLYTHTMRIFATITTKRKLRRKYLNHSWTLSSSVFNFKLWVKVMCTVLI